MRRTLHVHLDGAILIGGYTSPTGFLDAVTAADRDGRVVIPASALKGALREAVTRLHGGCNLAEPCQGDPCPACRLFGQPGTDTDKLLEACRDIDRLEREEITSFLYRRYHEGYVGIGLTALALLALLQWLELTRWRRSP